MKRIILLFGLLFGFCITGSDAQTVSQSVTKELAQLMLRNGDIENTCVREQGGISKAISVQPEYLNNDKQPEYVVSGDGSCCGGARRCNLWIYQKNAGGFTKIYGDTDGLQGDIKILKTRTKGYRDIRSTMYSGPDAYHAISKFDGRRYKHWKTLKPTKPGF